MQRESKAILQHSQICVSWQLWIVFSTLFISILPNSCIGACINTYLRYCMDNTLTLFFLNLESGTAALFLTSLTNENSGLIIHPFPPQLFRRDPECSSKVPLTHASNCRLKANARRVCTDQLGRGTYRVSPT